MEQVNPRVTENDKRKIHPGLRKALDLDVIYTKKFVGFLLNFVPIRSLKTHCMFLEYSCHGIVWLACWLAFMWMLDNPNLYQMQINMLFGLVLDIIFVACIKAATRRRRPIANGAQFSIGPDKFSFPSGHTSRAFYLLGFFTFLSPLPWYCWPSLFAWVFSIPLSRLILYRHHILDVTAGAVLGILEALLLGILWLGPDTSKWLMAYISDENLPGYATQEDTF